MVKIIGMFSENSTSSKVWSKRKIFLRGTKEREINFI